MVFISFVFGALNSIFLEKSAAEGEGIANEWFTHSQINEQSIWKQVLVARKGSLLNRFFRV